MEGQKKKKRAGGMVLAAAVLGAASLLLLFAARENRAFADWYSEHVYVLLVGSIGRITGLFPFSVAEMGLYILLVWLAGRTVWLAAGSWRKKRGFADWRLFGGKVLLLAGVLFFLYAVCCGVNYGRTSFAESSGLGTVSYSVEELKALCTELTERVNALSGQVSRNSRGTAEMGENVEERAADAMKNLNEVYEGFSGYYPRPKKLLLSQILSYQKLSGIYSPFTVEANINGDMAEYNLPFTACHELSHLRGFMQEEEANFIGFLACIRTDDTALQYSGYLTGWIYATNQLYRVDYEGYRELYDSLTPEALADLKENREFWRSYDGAVAEVSNQVNDSYLRANGQEEGVESYDRMVDLMMAYQKKEDGV